MSEINPTGSIGWVCVKKCPCNCIMKVDGKAEDCVVNKFLLMLWNCEVPPEALDIIEAVLAGAEIRREKVSDFLTGDKPDEFHIIPKPTPCPTCGGEMRAVFHIGSGNRSECVVCGSGKEER